LSGENYPIKKTSRTGTEKRSGTVRRGEKSLLNPLRWFKRRESPGSIGLKKFRRREEKKTHKFQGSISDGKLNYVAGPTEDGQSNQRLPRRSNGSARKRGRTGLFGLGKNS